MNERTTFTLNLLSLVGTLEFESMVKRFIYSVAVSLGYEYE